LRSGAQKVRVTILEKQLQAETSVTALPEDKNPDEESEEARLFREAVRGVRPLPPAAPPPRPLPVRPRARFTRADRAAVLRESLEAAAADPVAMGGEELAFHRPEVQSTVLRKLRRGEYRVEREIDLHGLTVLEAKHDLRLFLINALEQHVQCVRVVHGKGLRSGPRGPVLKATVNAVLRRTGAVLAFVSARQADGGSGAVYVLLSLT
jgi:DNA-nicking Smr family endonuclease